MRARACYWPKPWPWRTVCGLVSRVDRYLFLFWLAKANLNFHFYWPAEGGNSGKGKEGGRETATQLSLFRVPSFSIPRWSRIRSSLSMRLIQFDIPDDKCLFFPVDNCRDSINYRRRPQRRCMQCYCNSREHIIARRHKEGSENKRGERVRRGHIVLIALSITLSLPIGINIMGSKASPSCATPVTHQPRFLL